MKGRFGSAVSGGVLPDKKKPAGRRVFSESTGRVVECAWRRSHGVRRAVRRLLDLRFLVDHVLTDDGIVLFNLLLPGMFFLFLSVV